MRTLYIKRKRKMVASVMKAMIYISVDQESDLFLNDTHLQHVGTLKNGKSLEVQVTDEDFDLYVVFDKRFPNKFHTSHKVLAGQGNIKIEIYPRYAPYQGNPYTIKEL